MSIGAAAEHLGVSVEALRYYEHQGLVAPGRASSGHRSYGCAAMNALHVVVAMREVGFSIAEIAELIAQKDDAPPEMLVPRARRVLLERRDDLQRRREALDRADTLLVGWLAELDTTGL